MIQNTNTNSTINCKLFEVSIWIFYLICGLWSVVSMFQIEPQTTKEIFILQNLLSLGFVLYGLVTDMFHFRKYNGDRKVYVALNILYMVALKLYWSIQPIVSAKIFYCSPLFNHSLVQWGIENPRQTIDSALTSRQSTWIIIVKTLQCI